MAKRGNKLSGITTDMPASYKPSKAQMEEDRKYRAQDALRTLTKAQEIQRDRALMKDVKCIAKQQMKAVCK